jgi:hypothetical protein
MLLSFCQPHPFIQAKFLFRILKFTAFIFSVIVISVSYIFRLLHPSVASDGRSYFHFKFPPLHTDFPYFRKATFKETARLANKIQGLQCEWVDQCECYLWKQQLKTRMVIISFWHFNSLTNVMEHNHSWKVNSFSVSQNIPLHFMEVESLSPSQ